MPATSSVGTWNRNVLDFLIATGAEFDVDEYDLTGDDEDDA
ncbi:hypothetical protein ACFVHW_29370 [Streptomyces sp. NPDC127110]